MTNFRRVITILISASIVLSGCQTTGSGKGIDTLIGPKLSSWFEKEREAKIDPEKPRLDVVVPVFDPGLALNEGLKSQNDDSAEGFGTETQSDGVWPELRRAEANRFALKLKEALEKTGAFGAVRVTPDKTATADLYVQGKIINSNAEEVEIEVEVTDITGEVWFTRHFEHEVQEDFHKHHRNKGKDVYDPVFKKAADRIAVELEEHDKAALLNIQNVTELRFGANLLDNAFVNHIKLEDGIFKVESFPAENDPMLMRTRAVRVRDQLFIDGLQENYEQFNLEMEPSYLVWQEQSLQEIAAKREQQAKATGEAAAAVGLFALAILAAAAGANSSDVSSSALSSTGAIVAGAAGAHFLQKSFQTSEEAKVHRDALGELGQSVDMEMGPRVVEFENKTIELTGDAKEQFIQWRAFLKKMYTVEATPEKQL